MFKISQAAETQQREFSSMPDGFYRVFISDLEFKETKAGNGKYFAVTQCIVEPEIFNKRKLWSNFNFQNVNAQAVQIGQAQMADLMFAIGVEGIENEEDAKQKFIGNECIVEVTTRKARGNYPEQQEIAAHFSLAGEHRNSKRTINVSEKTAWWASDFQPTQSNSSDEGIPF